MRPSTSFSPGSTPLVAALAVLLALAGCGGGGSEPARVRKLPTGFRVYEAPDFVLAYPSSWGEVSSRPSVTGHGRYYQVLEPGPQDDLRPQIGLGRGGTRGSFSRIVDFNKTIEKTRYPRWRLVAERDIDVPGAKRAHLIETNYLLATRNGPPTPTREIQLLLQTPAGVQMDLAVRAPEQQFDSTPLRKVISAFRVR